jgi:hypothetical protein
MLLDMGFSAAEVLAEITALAGHDPDLREQLDKTVAAGVKYAQSIAPVGNDDDPHPGQFRDSIHSLPIPDVKGMPAGRIESDDPNGGYIEFGTDKTPEHGTFAKTRVYLESEYDAGVSETAWDRHDLAFE